MQVGQRALPGSCLIQRSPPIVLLVGHKKKNRLPHLFSSEEVRVAPLLTILNTKDLFHVVKYDLIPFDFLTEDPVLEDETLGVFFWTLRGRLYFTEIKLGHPQDSPKIALNLRSCWIIKAKREFLEGWMTEEVVFLNPLDPDPTLW